MTQTSVIFDLDGTLIEPRDAICSSINYALRKLGYPEVDQKVLLPYIGLHLAHPFSRITGIKDEEYLWKFIHAYREHYETEGFRASTLYPGVREMLAAVDSDKYIASIKPANASRLILKKLGIEDRFSGVYGGEIDGTRSDKAELLIYLKDCEGINDAIMVGDRDTDIYAARACGFRSIAAGYGYGTREELAASKPDILVEKPEDLAGALVRLMRRNEF